MHGRQLWVTTNGQGALGRTLHRVVARGRYRLRAAAWLLALVLVVGLPAAVGAQTAAAPAPPPVPAWPWAVPPLAVEGPWGSTLRLEVFERLRGEFVDWFGTPPNGKAPLNGPDYRYNFLGNKFQLGLRAKLDPVEVFVQCQETTIANLPKNGVGVGAAYYLNTPETLQNGAILRQAWGRIDRFLGIPGLSVKGGRELYFDGAEAAVQHPTLQWLQFNRISQRLIGPFDYTHTGRSFDGGQVAFDNQLLNVTAFTLLPTWGGYMVNGNPELDIVVGGLAVGLKDAPEVGPMNARLFWYSYNDHRDIVFLDNRPLPQRKADKGEPAEVQTLGAHVIRLFPIGPGIADGLAYGMGQVGKWQSLQQRSWAYGVEAGYRLGDVWGKPWMRLGINSGSGDTNPSDDIHGTFFQMLPTAWQYAQFPFFNMMNNQDVFVQWLLDPDRLVGLRLDFHWLRLNSGRDLLYSGGGATSNHQSGFGYAGIDPNGQLETAFLLNGVLTVRPTAYLLFNGFYGHAFGQAVINDATAQGSTAKLFVGNSGNYGFLEAVVSF